MAGPFTYPVADGLPMDNDPGRTTAITENVQDFINMMCAPDTSSTPTYLANGEVDFVEFFHGPTQIQSNRFARVDMTYNPALDPTTETWTLYDQDLLDGTTVKRLVVFTHTWVSSEYTKTTMSTT